MHNKPIGILDSGIGGLSVYQEITALLPYESFVYLGDNLRAPYGVLTAEEIVSRTSTLIQFLVTHNVKLIIIACNTITVTAIDKLRAAFPQVPIVGTVPVVKTAANSTRNNRIGILSTTRTAESTYQRDLIAQFAGDRNVINLGTDELVPLIERGVIAGKQLENVLQKVLLPFQQEHIDTLVLGCTHFPFIRDAVQRMLGKNVVILDSGGAIARQVKRILTQNSALATKRIPTHDFYTTGEASHMDTIAKKLLDATMTSTTVVL